MKRRSNSTETQAILKGAGAKTSLWYRTTNAKNVGVVTVKREGIWQYLDSATKGKSEITRHASCDMTSLVQNVEPCLSSEATN